MNLKREMYSKLQETANARWKNLTNCRVARITWPLYDIKRTRALMTMSRSECSRTIAIYTGHWPISDYAERLRISCNTSYRNCLQSSERETLYHFLCECPALSTLRSKLLENYYLGNIEDISNISVRRVERFAFSTKWV